MTRLPTHPVDAASPEMRLLSRIAELEKRVTLIERTGIFNTQYLEGLNNGYSGTFTAAATVQRDAAGTLPLALSLTPETNCWWFVHANVGLVNNTVTVANNNLIGQLNLTGTPATATIGNVSVYFTAASGSNQFSARPMSKVFGLTAGVAYTAQVVLTPSSGSWQYYQGSSQLQISAFAWPR